MSKSFSDGRLLFSNPYEVRDYLNANKIVGKTLIDIRPERLDYMINLSAHGVETFKTWNAPDGIQTDGKICLVFEDCSHLEAEIAGGGAPLVMGYNTGDLSKYPEYDGKCYKLSTMFSWALGQKVIDFRVEGNGDGCFPSYCGIDMSDEGTGIHELTFLLEDEIEITIEGYHDVFYFGATKKGQTNPVPLMKLWYELSEDVRKEIQEDFEYGMALDQLFNDLSSTGRKE